MYHQLQTSDERRRDPLLRDLIDRCQPGLQRVGFHLQRRGSNGDLSWVRFGRPGQDGHGLDGTLMLLLAHHRGEHAMIAEWLFTESLLDIQTPRFKQIQRYADETTVPQLVDQMVDSVCSWPTLA